MLKVIAFDADDTLWENEHFFREAEAYFCKLLSDYMPVHELNRELYRTEIGNMELYGYGIKPFILSLIETAVRISHGTVPTATIEKLIEHGKEMLQKPVVLLEGVEETLAALNGKYRLVMATKGDLVDQERKLKKSGLEKHFHHIEIMPDKQEHDYKKLIRHLDIEPAEFMMVGNSARSDVLPVLGIGGHAVHIPFHITWEHERVDVDIREEKYHHLENIRELISIV